MFSCSKLSGYNLTVFSALYIFSVIFTYKKTCHLEESFSSCDIYQNDPTAQKIQMSRPHPENNDFNVHPSLRKNDKEVTIHAFHHLWNEDSEHSLSKFGKSNQ